jgi:hypothetical protein
MNIPPPSMQIAAASIAGIDRAASTETAKSIGSSSSPASGPTNVVNQAEPVVKGDRAGDGDADGRQLHDSFQQRHRDQPGDDVHEDANDGRSASVVRDPGEQQPPAEHIDFQA